MGNARRSEKHDHARAALSPELRTAFDALVADYRFLGMTHCDRPFVSRVILAGLVRQGWRCTENANTIETNSRGARLQCVELTGKIECEEQAPCAARPTQSPFSA